jgi:uncharacterized protein (TIGR03067 family)
MMSFMIPVLALILVGDSDDDAKRKTDEARIQGTWVVRACHVGGKPSVRPAVQDFVSIEDDKMVWIRNGRRYPKGATITLDHTKSPRRIDFKGGQHDYVGIYEFEGRHLRICYHQKHRPTRFDSLGRTEEPYNVLLELEHE